MNETDRRNATQTGCRERCDALVLGEDHGERDHSRKDEKSGSLQDGARAVQEAGARQFAPTLEEKADDGHGEPHDGCQPEDGRDRVVQPGAPVSHEHLREGPSQTAEGAGRDDEDETAEDEVGLRRDHQKHAGRDEKDDADEAEGERLQAEEEGKGEDEDERGGLAHGCRRKFGTGGKGLVSSATGEESHVGTMHTAGRLL